MNSNLIQLTVLGFSTNPVMTNSYALILAELDGSRRIPVLIGAAEAQAIAIQLEGLKPDRPLTHDIFCSLAEQGNIEVEYVQLTHFEAGIFHSAIHCVSGYKEFDIDARTSDAIAIALRTNAPIFTSPDILERVGVAPMESQKASEQQTPNINSLPISELQRLLQQAVEREDYEQASVIRDIINQKQNPQ